MERQLNLSSRPEADRGFPRVLLLHLPLAVAVTVAVLFHADPDFTWHYLFREGWGAIELAHFLIPLAAAVYAGLAWLRLPADSDQRLSWLLAALAVGSVYIAGEEHSWGQHFFGWGTPESWASINRQAETNLHNTSSWLNQKPQVILTTLLTIAVIVVPLMRASGRGADLLARIRFVLPGPDSWPLGLLALFYTSWDALAKEGVLPKIAAREAEMFELFLYAFLLVFAHALWRRVSVWRVRDDADRQAERSAPGAQGRPGPP